MYHIVLFLILLLLSHVFLVFTNELSAFLKAYSVAGGMSDLAWVHALNALRIIASAIAMAFFYIFINEDKKKLKKERDRLKKK